MLVIILPVLLAYSSSDISNFSTLFKFSSVREKLSIT